MYRLDSTAFKPQTVEQAAKSHAEFYKALIWQERLKITNYLNSIVFNYPEQDLPQLDKNCFFRFFKK